MRRISRAYRYSVNSRNSYFQSILFGNFLRFIFFISLVIPFTVSCHQKSEWFRGNMHTHTFWSDGDDFPENVARWYNQNGYNFLIMTDHNIIQEGEKWISLPYDSPVLKKYLEDYGKEWPVLKSDDLKEGFQQVRLKTLDEIKPLYEERGRFTLIMGNEISSPHAVHLTTFYQDRILPASVGGTEDRGRMIKEVVERVTDYRENSGRNTYPALAHPNFRWAITAEMILDNPSLRFFEVYNGHPQVNNEGDSYRVSTERIWDIVLANRLRNGNGEVLFGLATDDAHSYYGGPTGPGKGWVMVRSNGLTPEAILDALDLGDFYASTGVVINEIICKKDIIKIRIKHQAGVKYLTEFIGTRRDFDPSNIPAIDSAGNEIYNTTRIYSDQIGELLAQSDDINPSYRFSGDELYVRVRITSTADHKDPTTGAILGKQRAWIQPVTP